MLQKIKWIISREGLLIIAIAAVLYLAKAYAPALPFPYPKVRLEFQDGSKHIIEIYPEMNAAELAGKFSSRELIKKYHCPSPELVSRRIDKFVADHKNGSALLDARCVNERQLYFYRLYFDLLYGPLVPRTLALYIFIVLIRLIFWLGRMVKKHV